MPKRRASRATLAPCCWARAMKSERRDTVDTSFQGMAGLLREGTSRPGYKSVTHVPEHLLPMSPVPTETGRGVGGGVANRCPSILGRAPLRGGNHAQVWESADRRRGGRGGGRGRSRVPITGPGTGATGGE